MLTYFFILFYSVRFLHFSVCSVVCGYLKNDIVEPVPVFEKKRKYCLTFSNNVNTILKYSLSLNIQCLSCACIQIAKVKQFV